MATKSKKSAKNENTEINVGTSWVSLDEGGAVREDGKGLVAPAGKRFVGFIGEKALKSDTGAIRYFGSIVAASGAVDDEISTLPQAPAPVETKPIPELTLTPEAQGAVAAFLAERQEAEAPESPKTKAPKAERAPKVVKSEEETLESLLGQYGFQKDGEKIVGELGVIAKTKSGKTWQPRLRGTEYLRGPKGNTREFALASRAIEALVAAAA